MRCFVGEKHNRPSFCVLCGLSANRAQNFVEEMTNVPNLKIDYVIINAGVLRYPNVGPATVTNKRSMLTIVARYRAVRRKASQCLATISLTLSYSSFDEFAFHLHTNTIGPIITAQKLLQTHIPIGTIVFMSSDSGSTTNFRETEDGFAAYAASKAALNQMLRVRSPFCFTRIPPLTIASIWPPN